jgi:hypothetical protein
MLPMSSNGHDVDLSLAIQTMAFSMAGKGDVAEQWRAGDEYRERERQLL